jgi:hypothetical protein
MNRRIVLPTFKVSAHLKWEDITILRNVCKYITVYKTSHLRRFVSLETPLWEHQTSSKLTDIFMVLVSPSRQISGQYLIRSRLFYSKLFLRHFIFIPIIRCYLIWDTDSVEKKLKTNQNLEKKLRSVFWVTQFWDSCLKTAGRRVFCLCWEQNSLKSICMFMSERQARGTWLGRPHPWDISPPLTAILRIAFQSNIWSFFLFRAVQQTVDDIRPWSILSLLFLVLLSHCSFILKLI